MGQLEFGQSQLRSVTEGQVGSAPDRHHQRLQDQRLSITCIVGQTRGKSDAWPHERRLEFASGSASVSASASEAKRLVDGGMMELEVQVGILAAREVARPMSRR